MAAVSTGRPDSAQRTRRAVGATRRLRNAVREALPVLDALVAAEHVPDRIGTYTLEAGEPLDEDEVLDFIRLARADCPGELTIIVTGNGTSTS
jgi:hypothetical protein